jgi:hypothetical protein
LTNSQPYDIINLTKQREIKKMLFKRKRKIKQYAVAYKWIDTDEIIVDVFDSHQMTWMGMDWAVEILAVKEV